MDTTRVKAEADDLGMRNRLGFHEIVPGPHPHEADGDEVDWIPEFDLGSQMMARHRQATARRRQAPKTRVELDPQETSGFDKRASVMQPMHWWLDINQAAGGVIRDIVAQDIVALCRGERVFD